MDYRYIEQLLQRYWEAETTPEEERILRAFFAQDELPTRLSRYKALFALQEAEVKEALGAAFDKRLLNRIESKPKPLFRLSHINLRPLYNAVAAVAIVVTVGLVAQRAFMNQNDEVWDYNTASYKDTFSDPDVARTELRSMLETMGTAFSTAEDPDSLKTAESNFASDIAQ